MEAIGTGFIGGLGDFFGCKVADTGGQDFAFFEQLSQCFHCFFELGGVVAPVALIKVDVISFKALQAVFAFLMMLLLFSVAINFCGFAVIFQFEKVFAFFAVPAQTKFCEELHFVAFAGDGAGDELFAFCRIRK